MKAKRPQGNFVKLLTEHVEKICLGVAVLLGLLIILLGFQKRQGIDPSKSPGDLQQQVTVTSSHIEGFGWDKDYKELRTQEENLLDRANETLRHVKVTDYAGAQYIKMPYHPPRKTRTDPQLFAAADLQARAGWGLMSKPSRSRQGNVFRRREVDAEEGRPIPTGFGSTRRGDGMGGYGGGGDDVEGEYFVVVTGLVPFRQQFQSYVDCFKTADDFNPSRDIPRYRDWTLERAPDVAGDGEPQWKKVASLRSQYREARNWGRSGMSMDYIDPQAEMRGLTSPLPPINGVELARLVRHERIDSREEAQRRARESRQDRSGRGDGGTWGDSRRGDGDRGRRGGRESDFQGGDFGDQGGFGGEMAPVTEQMYTGRPPARDGERRSYGGMRDGDSSMSGQTTGFENMDPKDVPEYVMFRYFDFDVSVNQSYIYRLQLELEDPNCPRDPRLDPDASALSAEVQLRLNENKKRQDRRTTEFSAASNVVTVASGQRILLGHVDEPRNITVASAGVSYQPAASEPKAEVVVMEFDAKGKRELPMEITVQPGSVGYFRGKVEPVYRWKNWLGKPEENTKIQVNTVILALRGGEDVGKGKLTEPGQMLAWNAATGKLVVHRELEDAADYPTFVFPPEDRMENNNREGGDFRRGGRGGDRGGEGLPHGGR